MVLIDQIFFFKSPWRGETRLKPCYDRPFLSLTHTHLAIGLPQTLSSIKLGSTPRRSSSDESEMRFCARLRLISAGVDAARPGESVLSPLYSRRSLRRLIRPLNSEEGPSWRILLPSRLTSTSVRQRLSPRRFPMLLPWKKKKIVRDVFLYHVFRSTNVQS